MAEKLTFFKDIEARKRLGLNTAFLSEVSRDIICIDDPVELMEQTSKKIQDFLGVVRVVFVKKNEPSETIYESHSTVEVLYDRDDSQALSTGQVYYINDYPDFSDYADVALYADLYAGKQVVVSRVATTPATAFVLTPHLSDGRWSFLLAVYHRAPRLWRSDEVDLLQELATRLWGRLARSYDEEKRRERERRKDRFMALFSDELRALLPSIENSTSLDDSPLEPPLEKLTALIDRLDYIPVNYERIQLQRSRIDLNHLVKSTVERHRFLFENRGEYLTFSSPDHPIEVFGDPARLGQVVSNLLTNAARFTPGGFVSVVVSQCTRTFEAKILISDVGKGMDVKTQLSLFEPFTGSDESREHPSDRFGSGGFGLGLALVKHLVEVHGGKVEASSPGVDHGAEFVVTLPLGLSDR